MIEKVHKPEVNEANIGRVLRLVAGKVADGKSQYVPLMERLEKELKLCKEARDPSARARAILNDYAAREKAN